MDDGEGAADDRRYVEGERVLGPPQGTYDSDWVAAAAREAEPGLPWPEAHRLAVAAWEHLRTPGVAADDAPALARALLARELDGGAASAATAVARTAVEFVRLYRVDTRS